MSPAPLAPRSFLEVPVNSGGGSWVVAEEGVPGKEGLGTGMGIAEPVFVFFVFLMPAVHMCVCSCVSGRQMSYTGIVNSSGDNFILRY